MGIRQRVASRPQLPGWRQQCVVVHRAGEGDVGGSHTGGGVNPQLVDEAIGKVRHPAGVRLGPGWGLGGASELHRPLN